MLLGPHGALLGEADQASQHYGHKLLHHSAAGRCRKQAATSLRRYAVLPDEELGSRQRRCGEDLAGKERKKRKNPLACSEGGGERETEGLSEEVSDWPLKEVGGRKRRGRRRRHVPPLERRSFASGSELLMEEEGGSQP